MEIADILRQLERATGTFPRAAVEAAITRREEIIPELLRILQDVVDRAAQLENDEDYMAHLYAMFLLAQFREPRAYPLVVRFASLPGDLLYTLCGDFITSDLDRVLASICGGQLEGIQSLIENESGDEWVRGAALSSLVILVATGQKSREEIVVYFACLFRGKLARRWSHVWDQLVCCTCNIYPGELMDDIAKAYEHSLVDPAYITLANVRRDLAMPKGQVLAKLSADPHRSLVMDTIKEMSWWSCFRDNKPNRADRAAETPGKTEVKSLSTETFTQRKVTNPKIGRNEPCPCGSGKKYKKCCTV